MPFKHYLPRALPEPLQGLAVMALDLRWSWHHGADRLWRAVDPALWEATQNPWLILETVGDERLKSLAADTSFLEQLREQLEARDEHLNAPAWFASRQAPAWSGSVAYFSMEFGVSEALPIYSGGLGVLAGDHLKTASDLGVPVIGIGLLYQEGYFRQAIDANGEQLEFYPYNDPTMLPVVPLRNDDGEWIRLDMDLPGRVLRLRTWRAEVGRRLLLLLDSNDPLNEPGDRGITSELYGGGPEMRLQQEIVLGIGGWRLLEVLQADCPVCHLNEGHAGFAVLERARHFMMRSGRPFATALRATRAGNLFTTHTPVAAGFDRFSPELFALYFRSYAQTLGVDVEELLALGRANPHDAAEPFNMAYLALRGAGAANGVSRLHGEVSRQIFEPLFGRWPRREIPVGHVTNGVHVPTWDSAAADALWTEACGQSRWRGELEDVEASLRRIEDEQLWRFRREGCRRLAAFLAERLARQRSRIGAADGIVLDPDVLTIGFGRRFAEYKRTNLLLRDRGRLLSLLANRDRPVQLVVAGKAHPRDAAGKRMIREWQDFVRTPGASGRAVFVEDYDLVVAGRLVQGVDIWLNTPRRPWEASGTSGMKVLVNGGLNLSELDGWWAEAYAPEVGWPLGDGREHADARAWDAAEAEALFRCLETQVVPCFYERDEHGLPREWIRKMRESMARLTTQFSSNRMLRDYVDCYYGPLAEAVAARDAETADALERWCAGLAANWSRVHFGSVKAAAAEERLQFEVQVYLYQLPPESVRVEVYADPSGAADADADAERHPLERGEALSGAGNAYLYRGGFPSGRSVADYTPRVVPAHPAAIVPLEAPFITWYR